MFWVRIRVVTSYPQVSAQCYSFQDIIWTEGQSGQKKELYNVKQTVQGMYSCVYFSPSSFSMVLYLSGKKAMLTVLRSPSFCILTVRCSPSHCMLTVWRSPSHIAIFRRYHFASRYQNELIFITDTTRAIINIIFVLTLLESATEPSFIFLV